MDVGGEVFVCRVAFVCRVGWCLNVGFRGVSVVGGVGLSSVYAFGCVWMDL